MQKKIPKIYFFYCFYGWKEGGQHTAIKYKGKKHPIKSKASIDKNTASRGVTMIPHPLVTPLTSSLNIREDLTEEEKTHKNTLYHRGNSWYTSGEPPHHGTYIRW